MAKKNQVNKGTKRLTTITKDTRKKKTKLLKVDLKTKDKLIQKVNGSCIPHLKSVGNWKINDNEKPRYKTKDEHTRTIIAQWQIGVQLSVLIIQFFLLVHMLGH